MKVSIKDIAAKAGVSTATVSLALNGSDLVKDSTKERVQQLAKEMGYVPNPYARKLVLQKSGMLGLVVPTIRNVYYAYLVDYINAFVREAGYGLQIATSDNSPKMERKILDEMRINQVEGIMLAPVNVPNFGTNYIEEIQVPLVYTTGQYLDSEHPTVMCDLKQGMYDITKLLVDKGHRSLAFITGQVGVHTLDLREAGFLEAAKNSKTKIFRLDRLSYNSAREVTGEILEYCNRFDAIVCVDDTVAVGVINALQTAGIDIPRQIAVTGFDNNILSHTAAVPLTSVTQDVEQIARKTVEIVLDAIAGKPVKNVTIPCTIHHRKSV